MERTGIEPATPGLQSQRLSLEEPESEALRADPGEGCSADDSTVLCEWASRVPDDAQLARLVEAWPSLPEAVRAGVLAMVEAVAPRQGGEG